MNAGVSRGVEAAYGGYCSGTGYGDAGKYKEASALAGGKYKELVAEEVYVDAG